MQEEGGHQKKEHQERIQYHPPRHLREEEAGRQGQAGEEARFFIEEPLCKNERDEDREKARQRGRKSICQLRVFSKKERRKVDEPEEKRRLLGVNLSVQVRDDPVTAVSHLPGHDRVSRLVRFPQVPLSEVEEKNSSRK